MKYLCVCNLCDRKFKDDRRRTRCPGCYTKIRRYRNKRRAILLKGGRCECGYEFDGYNIAAFEFHHLDPNKKEFALGKVANKSWAVIVKEIEKCILMCSNCHRIEHSNITDALIEEAYRYGRVA